MINNMRGRLMEELSNHSVIIVKEDYAHAINMSEFIRSYLAVLSLGVIISIIIFILESLIYQLFRNKTNSQRNFILKPKFIIKKKSNMRRKTKLVTELENSINKIKSEY